MLKIPLIVVNFKAYKEGVGRNAARLAKICEKVAGQKRVEIAVAVQSADIRRIAGNVSIPVFAQHTDANEFGPFTGSILPESAKENGAVGSLINHSEKPVDIFTAQKIVKRLSRLKMTSILCSDNSQNAMKFYANTMPDFLAIEPPELIGGNISVASARPEIISEVAGVVEKPVICGAGIKTKNDVLKAIELGAKGILVSSGVVCAQNPQKVLKELADGLKKRRYSAKH